jgi:O-antigen/teichoic acid export membrane protein
VRLTVPETQTIPPTVEPAPPGTRASGARSGALLVVASAVSIVANYVFLLAAGRLLGSNDYGSLAALLGLLSVVLLPAGALQLAVSREVSRRVAGGDVAGADLFGRATFRLAALATLPLVVVALALAAPLQAVLNIDSVGIVVLAETALVTALIFPVAMGVLQGHQRFHALAAMYVVPFLLRLLVLAVVAAAGWRLGGAVFATLVSTLAATALAIALIRSSLRHGATGAPPNLGQFLHYLAPVAIGVIGIALLTNVDILVVKARFSGDTAGAYAAASAFARVGFFLPATILSVLFPRTAARQARGEETEDILGRSLLATAAFCGGLALFYAAAGVGLVVTTFGTDFSQGGEVLAPYAIATGLFSLANILVGYHLSRGETRYAWIVGSGAIVQVAVLALVPTTLHGVVYANLLIGAGLIGAHELFVGSSAPAIRAGLRHVRGAVARTRAVLPEAAGVLIGTTAFVCALFWPLVVHLRSTIAGDPGSDATATVATFWQLQHEGGYHLFGITHHTLSGAPFGWDSTNALNMQTFLAYYPTYLAARVVGAIAAFNLVTLAGFVLSGATMYLLVRYLGCARLVAAWAALAYIVFPWHMARVEHASLLQLEVLALLVLTLVAAARRPSWLRFGFVGAANLACWLMSGYFGPMALVTTVAFMLGAAVTSSRRRGLLLVGGAGISAFAAAGIFGIAAVASGTNSGAGLARAVGDLSIYGLRPIELVVPPARNLVLGSRLDSFWNTHTHGSNGTEVTNYLGLLTFAFAITWLVIAVRRRRSLSRNERIATPGLVVAFVAALAFAAPSPILLFGHNVSMPSRLLWQLVPAFRVVSRWDTVLMTALVPLAAFGLQAIWRSLARPGWPRVLPAAVVGVAMIISFLELAIHPVQNRFRTVPKPPEYSVVGRTPQGILAEYPLGYSDIYRLWQSRHGRPLLNGAPPDTQADYARLVLLDPVQPGTARTLSLLGVTAIAIHPYAHVDAEVRPTDPAHSAGYRLLGRFPDAASVWQVIASPAPALVTLPGGFAKPQRLQDGSVGYPFVSPAGVGVIDVAAKRSGIVQIVLDAIPPDGKKLVLRVADSKAEQAFTLNGRTRVSVVVEVPLGQSQLLVKTDPAPASPADAIVLVAPRAEQTSSRPGLHADLISPAPGF